VYFQIDLRGSSTDLHSGSFGGAVANPAFVLSQMIAQMKDRGGRIKIPGFYDDVAPLQEEERKAWASLSFNEKKFKKDFGVPKLFGESGYTTLERTWARPTFEVNGLLSGFTGEGQKTVLPARAMAKISTRLVPYQDDKEIEQQFRAYLTQHAPPTVRWDLRNLSSAPGVLVERDTAAAHAASEALAATFGTKPLFRLEGGSVPVVSLVQAELGVDSILMGFGLPDDNLHAPNEKLHLPNYFRGIEAYIRFFHDMSQ